MARIVLVLLVTLNLTLVCMGHEQADHHTDIHLSFLGEPEHEQASLDSKHSADHAGNAPHENADNATNRKQTSLSLTATCITVAISGNTLPEIDSLSRLGVATIGLLANLCRTSIAGLLSQTAKLCSQTTLRPPSPPPEPSALRNLISE